MTDKVDKITDHETLVKAVEEYANEDTLVRIVEMMDKAYNIHRLYINDKVYFVGIEGDHGVPLIGTTDPFECIDFMEYYLIDELAAYVDVAEYRVSNQPQSPKYIMN